jgi:hypothetical protein
MRRSDQKLQRLLDAGVWEARIRKPFLSAVSISSFAVISRAVVSILAVAFGAAVNLFRPHLSGKISGNATER